MNPIRPPSGAWFDNYAGLWLIVCLRCGKWKTQLAFRIDRKYQHGFDAVCKDCRAAERNPPPEKS